MIPFLLLSAALATPGFPPVVAEWSKGSPPSCALCHQGTPMKGTATTLFATTLRARGLTANNEASLRAALTALGSADSDAVGVTDMQELRDGTSPNAAASDTQSPSYGCTSAPGGGGVLLWLLVARVCREAVRRMRRRFEPAARSAVVAWVSHCVTGVQL